MWFMKSGWMVWHSSILRRKWRPGYGGAQISFKAVCLLDAGKGELWVQTELVCFNLRNEETVQVLEQSRMQVAGVLLTPTVPRCACEFHGQGNWASPHMVPSQFRPR